MALHRRGRIENASARTFSSFRDASPTRAGTASRRCRPGRVGDAFPAARSALQVVMSMLHEHEARQETAISPIADIIAELKAGRMVVLVDEEDRENEGDLLIARRVRDGRSDQLHGALRPRADLPHAHRGALPRAEPAADGRRTTARRSAPTSRSRSKRRKASRPASRRPTARARCRPRSGPTRARSDLVQPGHIFPLMAQDGGVLVRAGHTEAGCDLARLAGLDARGGDLRDPEGRRRDGAAADLVEFAAQHKLKIGTITDLIQYRSRTESLVTRVAERDIETVHGALPPGRLQRPHRARDAPRAGEGRASRRARKCWCACTSRCRSSTCSTRGSTSHSWNFHDALAAIARAGLRRDPAAAPAKNPPASCSSARSRRSATRRSRRWRCATTASARRS